jgi:subtilisin family serine protease
MERRKRAGTDELTRRIHPKLRMFDNGSLPVNRTRADISTQVACSRAEPVDKDGKPLLDLDISAAQRDVRNLSLDATGLVKGGLEKRPKFEDVEKADDAFVNVVIETVRSSRKDKGETTHRIAELCRKRLAAGKAKGISGSVIEGDHLVAATVPVTFLKDLEQMPEVAFVHGSDPLKLDIPESSPAGAPSPRNVGDKAIRDRSDEVIIGIIDVEGFDFAHPDFLDDGGQTRFLAIWDQGGDFRPSPKEFGYGAEFRKEDLDKAIKASKKPGGLPAVLLEPQSQQVDESHGTHVASIAAGKSGVCPKATIAAVLVSIPLPETEAEQRRFTFSDSSRILHAVEYLLDIAEALGKPISINISLGTNGGAHDGSGGVSRWLDARLATPGRAICVAAGNAGQESAIDEEDMGWVMGRIHTSGRVAARGLSVDLEWVVVGNGIADMSENELEIWYGAQDRLTVQVMPPGHDDWFTVKPQEFIENRRLKNGTTFSVYNELYHPGNGANYISIYLSPNLQPGQIRGVQAGVWRVRLHGEDIRSGAFHAWIERDDPQDLQRVAGGARLFRFPSFFSAATNVDSHSISSLACGNSVISVANLDLAREIINRTSSQGPTRDMRLKPDIAAPGTDIVAARGFSVDGGEWTSMSGTSMASPYVTGVIGLMLVANPTLNASQCIGILQRTARPLPGGSYDWKDNCGFGRIDPVRALEEAQGFSRRVPVAE